MAVTRKATTLLTLLFAVIIASILLPTVNASLLDPSSAGFGSQTRASNYDALLDALYNNGNVTSMIGDKLWVPWFATSSSCQVADLQRGGNCNSGEMIDFSHNCMVTDEFSQVGILVAMGEDQARMDGFFNTVNAINSSHGRIPAWRVYRSGSTIEQCRSGINGNCDTASDATARIIIALYTARNNTLFSNSAQRARYGELATNLSAAFVQHEVLYSCKQSSLGHGDICWWLAAGSNAKSGGLESTDFGYSGYYADAIIAMLQACTQTGNMTYCQVAGNFTLNYLEASKFDGSAFHVPPGRSFKWSNLSGIPAAVCTNTCNPDKWDGADAPRALGMCQANYYAQQINVTLPELSEYCQLWGAQYMSNPATAPLQYYADGTPAASFQSGYFAQGLQALFQSGGHNPSLFAATLDNALGHYSTTAKTWDNAACFGIYTQAFPMRALGFGIGRDSASFPALSLGAPTVPYITPNSTPTLPANASVNITNNSTDGTITNTTNVTQNSTANSTNSTPQVPYETPSPEPLANISFYSFSPALQASIAEPANQSFVIAISNPDGLGTTIRWYLNGTPQAGAFNSSTYLFIGNYSTKGSWNITVVVSSSQNTIRHTFSLLVIDTPFVTPQQNTTGQATNQSVNQTGTGNASQNSTNTTVPAPAPNSTQINGSTAINTTAPNTTVSNTTGSAAPTATSGSSESPTSSRGGGGGGGGGLIKKPTQTKEPGAVQRIPTDSSKDLQLKSKIDSYFAGNLTAREATNALREYYGDS